MAMDHLPRPANPTIDLGGIPATQDTFRSIRQFSVIDKFECQKRYISMTLNLGIDHVVPWIHERRLHFLHRRQAQVSPSPTSARNSPGTLSGLCLILGENPNQRMNGIFVALNKKGRLTEECLWKKTRILRFKVSN